MSSKMSLLHKFALLCKISNNTQILTNDQILYKFKINNKISSYQDKANSFNLFVNSQKPDENRR